VQHLGVEVERIAFAPRTWDHGRPLSFLLAASFREKKGIPDALEAIAGIRDQVREVFVTIIGDSDTDVRSHPEKERILETLARTGLDKRTRMLGYQPHAVLFEEAYRHHIFISASRTAGDGDTEGGAPVTLIEMAATGMPIISTTHCDIPSVIRHGVTGLLAAEGDVPGLTANLRQLVASPAIWHEMVKRSRQHVEAEFNVRTQALRLAEIYRRAAGK
jgi:colanic acid/amylovoran biosynthesis glycosyltransferase